MTACNFAPGCSSNTENFDSEWSEVEWRRTCTLAEAPAFIITHIIIYLFVYFEARACDFPRPTHEARYGHGAPRRRRVLGSARREPAVQRGRAHGSRRDQGTRRNASIRQRARDAPLRAACAPGPRPVVPRQVGSVGSGRSDLAQVRVLTAAT